MAMRGNWMGEGERNNKSSLIEVYNCECLPWSSSEHTGGDTLDRNKQDFLQS